MVKQFPQQQPGVNYLTEGGQETEILYKYGFELPHFAMFPLLDNPRAMTELRGMYAGTSTPPPAMGSAWSWVALTTERARTGRHCSATAAMRSPPCSAVHRLPP